MKQKIKTPDLMNCVCGEVPKLIDISDSFYNPEYYYKCACCGKKTRRHAGNKHRAICRWNNYISAV